MCLHAIIPHYFFRVELCKHYYIYNYDDCAKYIAAVNCVGMHTYTCMYIHGGRDGGREVYR